MDGCLVGYEVNISVWDEVSIFRVVSKLFIVSCPYLDGSKWILQILHGALDAVQPLLPSPKGGYGFLAVVLDGLGRPTPS